MIKLCVSKQHMFILMDSLSIQAFFSGCVTQKLRFGFVFPVVFCWFPLPISVQPLILFVIFNIFDDHFNISNLLSWQQINRVSFYFVYLYRGDLMTNCIEYRAEVQKKKKKIMAFWKMCCVEWNPKLIRHMNRCNLKEMLSPSCISVGNCLWYCRWRYAKKKKWKNWMSFVRLAYQMINHQFLGWRWQTLVTVFKQLRMHAIINGTFFLWYFSDCSKC